MNDFTRVSIMDIQLMDKSFDLDQTVAENEFTRKNNAMLILVVVTIAGIAAVAINAYLNERKELKLIRTKNDTERYAFAE